MFIKLAFFAVTLTVLCCSGAAWQNDPNCGIKGPSQSDLVRIINGTDAGRHEFPWQVLQIQIDGESSCGASILSPFWILTAAHCIFNQYTGEQFPVESFQIIAGAYNQNHEKEPGRIVSNASAVYSYPTFDFDHGDGDIALFKLKQPLPLNDTKFHLRAVCLPEKEPLDAHVNETAVISGWGINNDNSGHFSEPDNLQTVNVTILKQSICAAKYQEMEFGLKVTKNMICTATTDHKGVCGGDSGSPMMLFNEAEQRWYQYGVVSWSYAICATPGYGDVYARVSQLIDWITEITAH